MDDSKLKFLPRHLQRTQPAGSGKSKRRVTVENEEAGDEENDRRKPSVFERLGPGASQRTEKTSLCIDFQKHGVCQYGKSCPFSHNIKSKGQMKRDEKETSDDLRLKFKGQAGKDRESKVKSQVVVRKAGGESDDESGEDSDNWSIDKLASKKEMELERKRQEIQRALNALEATEEVDDPKKHSESSESESSPERPAKKKKEKASKKEKRKKHKKSALEKEKAKEAKRKYDSDEEDSSQKNQKKKKKKKQKRADDAAREATVIKSSKLLSPLKKVLKQKKGGSESITSAKRAKSNRSTSVDSSSRRRGRSSEQESSSESSPSPSPVKRKKMSAAPDRSQDRQTKKRSRSSEKKRYADRRSDRRSVSSTSSPSSSPSSSSSPSPSRSRSATTKSRKSDSGKDFSRKAHQTRVESPVQGRKEKREKKKRDRSAESWTASKDSSIDRSKGRQALGQHEKTRGMREREERYDAPTSSGKRGKRAVRDTSKGGRHEGKESKEMLMEGRGGTRGEWGDKDGGGRKDKRRGDAGRDNEDDRMRLQKSDRDSRETKGSLERQDRMRRAGGFGSGHSYPQQSSHHGGQRASDNDNRHYDDTSGPYASELSRGNQYQTDRQRRSERGDVYDRRDAMDSRNDRGPGRFNRGNDNGDGRGWDDRRHGGESYGRDEWSGRERPPGHCGTDEDPREFGRRMDERRKGRDERLPPHFGDAELPKDSRFPQMGDMRNQRAGGGHRDEYIRDRPGMRDWKFREGSHDSSSRRDLGDAGDKQPTSRERQRGGMSRSANDAPRDRPNDKETEKMKRDVSSKISSPGMLNLKSQSVKEDSPITRDEPSLASLFSQTETVAPVKKKTTKSFGGKKSPKKSAEEAKSEKGKSGLASRLGANSKRPPEKKSGLVVSKPREEKADNKTKDIDKPDKSKDKVIKPQSPKGSHKSEDSPRSRHSQTRSRRSSKSPDSKRQTSTRSPAPNRSSDNTKSDTRQSHSPAPSSGRDRDKREASQRSPATSSTRDRRRKDESKRSDEQAQHKSQPERGKKRERSKSHSSEEESHLSTDDKKRRRSSDSDSMPAKLEGGDIAAAMLGDGIDDGQQEEKVFSDWSDDDVDDNILMGGDSRKSQPHMLIQAEDLDELPDGMMDGGRMGRRPLLPPSHFMERDIRPKPEIRIEPLKEKPALEKNIPNVKIVEDIQKEKPAREKRRRDADNEGYEEISSDENDLDEEGEKINKRTIVSILDIDLTSLMPMVKQKPVSGPVFMRYKAANVFAELGISRRFAGDSLFKEVQESCQKQLEEMVLSEQEDQGDQNQQVDGVSNKTVKEESTKSVPTSANKGPEMAVFDSLTEPILSPPDTPSGSNEFEQPENEKPKLESVPINLPDLSSPTVKIENIKKTESTEKPKPLFELYSDSCAIHRFTKLRAKERAGLFNNAAMLSRALTARRDLDIRRRLCKIPHNYEQSAIYPSGVIEPNLHQMCSQIFKQNRPLTLSTNLTASC